MREYIKYVRLRLKDFFFLILKYIFHIKPSFFLLIEKTNSLLQIIKNKAFQSISIYFSKASYNRFKSTTKVHPSNCKIQPN